MNRLFFVLTLSIILPTFGFAETAILCGDLEKSSRDDKFAEVHVDFDRDDVVKNKGEVQFFKVFGIPQEVVSAKTEKSKIQIETTSEIYSFEKVTNCDEETTIGVNLLKADKRLECLCYRD